MLRTTAADFRQTKGDCGEEVNRDGSLAVNSTYERPVSEIHIERYNSGVYQ